MSNQKKSYKNLKVNLIETKILIKKMIFSCLSCFANNFDFDFFRLFN
jgi:hypothetical protein